MTETTLTDATTTLNVCLHDAKGKAKLAAAWAEATDLFSHHAKVAKTFAANARHAAQAAQEATDTAARLVPTSKHAKSEQAQHALADAERTREYAAQAAASAAHATASAQAARRFVPQRGLLSDLCKTHREAVWTWLHCSEFETVKLAVLRARVEEAEAAVQAALPVPATA